MSAPLDRLAASQYVAFWERQKRRDGQPQDYPAWAAQAEPIKSMWREIVRAILTALREPDEGMIAAGIKQLAECTDDWSVDAAPCIAEHVFPAMIDHILGEGQ